MTQEKQTKKNQIKPIRRDDEARYCDDLWNVHLDAALAQIIFHFRI